MASLTRSQRFLIGCFFAVIGIAFAGWAFWKGCLEGAQPQIIQALIPLAAAFAAWSFHGSLTIDASQNIGTKIAVAATGGFAIWLGTAYILVPRSDEACKKMSVREELIRAVGLIRNVRGDFAFARTVPAMARKVVANAPAAIVAVENVDPKGLWSSERIHRNAYIGLGYLYLGAAWDMVETDRTKTMEFARKSLKYSEQAWMEFEQLFREAQDPEKRHVPRYVNWLSWIQKDHYDEFLHQNIGRAHLLAYKAGVTDFTGARDAFKRISRKYMADNGLYNDVIVRWFCGTNPKEEAICA